MIKIAIECAIFCYDDGTLKVLLSKENNNANAKWGILSGMLKDNESADDTASRLAQEYGTGKYIFLRQLRTFINPDQQSSDRNVTIEYYALINIDNYRSNFGASPYYKRWWKVTDVPDLLFNHNKILDLSLHQIRNALRESAVGFELLPEEFTLSELTNLYKEILGIEANELIFSKKNVQKKIIVPLADEQKSGEIETERRYKFNVREYEKLAMERKYVIF
ncbi:MULTISPECIES: NUDIX hydrolase [Flavobacterium]|uniref:NUDIX hydrolase n=1 Tax=Flavobacterium TaxID=237 RepID=UPI002113EADC|nr:MULTISPECIES: NUDIX hydrolase [Flavobacterium]UUF12511.1 NUDIX hydrolase [Flavobacterium panici]